MSRDWTQEELQNIGYRGQTYTFDKMAGLAEAKDNYLLGKLEKLFRQADLLTLDEMGYVSFDRFQSEMVFKAVSDRSERGSVIVTTNLPFSQWTELFQNTAMVAALVDRLTFKSFVLDMNGDSFRLDQSLKSKHL